MKYDLVGITLHCYSHGAPHSLCSIWYPVCELYISCTLAVPIIQYLCACNPITWGALATLFHCQSCKDSGCSGSLPVLLPPKNTDSAILWLKHEIYRIRWLKKNKMTWFPSQKSWYTNAGIWVWVKLGRWIPSLRNIKKMQPLSQNLTHIHFLRKTPRIFHDTFETSKTMGSNLTNTEKERKEPNEFHFSWSICVKKSALQRPQFVCAVLQQVDLPPSFFFGHRLGFGRSRGVLLRWRVDGQLRAAASATAEGGPNRLDAWFSFFVGKDVGQKSKKPWVGWEKW